MFLTKLWYYFFLNPKYYTFIYVILQNLILTVKKCSIIVSHSTHEKGYYYLCIYRTNFSKILFVYYQIHTEMCLKVDKIKETKMYGKYICVLMVIFSILVIFQLYRDMVKTRGKITNKQKKTWINKIKNTKKNVTSSRE